MFEFCNVHDPDPESLICHCNELGATGWRLATVLKDGPRYVAFLEREHPNTMAVFNRGKGKRPATKYAQMVDRTRRKRVLTVNNFPVSIRDGNEIIIHTQPEQLTANHGKIYLTRHEVEHLLREIKHSD